MTKKLSKKPYTEKRPWGSFTEFVTNTPATVKILFVKAGQSLSLQYHQKRIEFWHVLSGTGVITVGRKKYSAKQGKEFVIPKKELHRISADTDLQILEIATGVFDEKDIVRIEDIYGRAEEKKKQ